jgi:SAM-dependent methyltransferase
VSVDCRWCGGVDLVVIPTVISKYGDREYRFEVCHKCGTKFALPWDTQGIDYGLIQRRHAGYVGTMAANAYIASLLARGPDAAWTAAACEYLCLRPDSDGRFVHAIRRCMDAASEGRVLRILEVGCNLGYFGAVVSRFGHKYTGLDVQTETVAQAGAVYGHDYRAQTIEAFAAEAGEQFDLIVSFEVIEHVSDPRAFFDSCVALLKPKGVLILTTPNGTIVGTNEWFSVDLPPIHMAVFCRKSFDFFPDLNVRFLSHVGYGYTLDGAAWLAMRPVRAIRRWWSVPKAQVTDPASTEFYAAVRPFTLSLDAKAHHRRGYVRQIIKDALLRVIAAVLSLLRVDFNNPLVVEISRKADSGGAV